MREGRAALGTGLKEFASSEVPWIIGASGLDYCMIDHEHGAFDLETIADLAGWFQAADGSRFCTATAGRRSRRARPSNKALFKPSFRDVTSLLAAG